MLSWLRRRNQAQIALPVPRAGKPRWSVSFDDTFVHLGHPDGSRSELAWAHLASVGIVTTSDGPAAPDLFWLLQPHDRRSSLIIHMGADGEHELLHAMQERLPGFDNMTVIEAMSSTDQAGFVVWQAGEPSQIAQT